MSFEAIRRRYTTGHAPSSLTILVRARRLSHTNGPFGRCTEYQSRFLHLLGLAPLSWDLPAACFRARHRYRMWDVHTLHPVRQHYGEQWKAFCGALSEWLLTNRDHVLGTRDVFSLNPRRVGHSTGQIPAMSILHRHLPINEMSCSLQTRIAFAACAVRPVALCETGRREHLASLQRRRVTARRRLDENQTLHHGTSRPQFIFLHLQSFKPHICIRDL